MASDEFVSKNYETAKDQLRIDEDMEIKDRIQEMWEAERGAAPKSCKELIPLRAPSGYLSEKYIEAKTELFEKRVVAQQGQSSWSRRNNNAAISLDSESSKLIPRNIIGTECATNRCLRENLVKYLGKMRR